MIRVLGNIRHDGVMYKHGDTIQEIKEEDAERLIRLGVALFVEEIEVFEEDSTEEVDIKEEIDKRFNAVELKEIAEELEIKFPGNISKTKLIDLILELEKAEEALEFEFVEED